MPAVWSCATRRDDRGPTCNWRCLICSCLFPRGARECRAGPTCSWIFLGPKQILASCVWRFFFLEAWEVVAFLMKEKLVNHVGPSQKDFTLSAPIVPLYRHLQYLDRTPRSWAFRIQTVLSSSIDRWWFEHTQILDRSAALESYGREDCIWRLKVQGRGPRVAKNKNRIRFIHKYS